MTNRITPIEDDPFDHAGSIIRAGLVMPRCEALVPGTGWRCQDRLEA